jgi:hypothetical protein
MSINSNNLASHLGMPPVAIQAMRKKYICVRMQSISVSSLRFVHISVPIFCAFGM